MPRSEFIDHVEFGADIMFDVRGKHLTVLGWNEEGPMILEQVTEANEAVFPNAQAMLDGYIIDGERLRDIWDEVEITYCTCVKEMVKKIMTTDEMRNDADGTHAEIVYAYGDKEFVLYVDGDDVRVDTDAQYYFDSWDDMLAAPIYWGKTLEEIVSELVLCD